MSFPRTRFSLKRPEKSLLYRSRLFSTPADVGRFCFPENFSNQFAQEEATLEPKAPLQTTECKPLRQAVTISTYSTSDHIIWVKLKKTLRFPCGMAQFL